MKVTGRLGAEEGRKVVGAVNLHDADGLTSDWWPQRTKGRATYPFKVSIHVSRATSPKTNSRLVLVA